MRVVSTILKGFFKLAPNASRKIRSGRMRGIRWILCSANPGQAFGRYEPEQENVIADLLAKSQVFWDVGAHAGWYSLLAHKLMPETAKVISFEPNPANYSFVKKHLEINNASRVESFDLALSDESGSAQFSGKNQTGGLNDQPSDATITVPTTTADDFIEQYGWVPDLIKMDVEGAEDKVLSGATRLLSKHKPTLLLSTHGWKKRDHCKALLHAYGYTITDLVENIEQGDYVFLATVHR